MTILIALQMFFGAALAWSCFCRLVRVDIETVREIRLSIWFLGVVSGLVLGAPVLPLMVEEIAWSPWHTPNWVWLMLLFGTTFKQMSTSRYWWDGVPDTFKIYPKIIFNRRSTDPKGL